MEIYTRLYRKDLILSGTFLRVSLNLNRCRRKAAGSWRAECYCYCQMLKGGGGRGGVQEGTEGTKGDHTPLNEISRLGLKTEN